MGEYIQVEGEISTRTFVGHPTNTPLGFPVLDVVQALVRVLVDARTSRRRWEAAMRVA